MRSKLGGIVPFHTNLYVPKMQTVSPLLKRVPSSVGYAATFPRGKAKLGLPLEGKLSSKMTDEV